MVLRVMAAIAVVVCSVTPRALAQQVEAPALVLTPSARSVGMGLTGTADDSDPMNTFLNPAVLGSLDGLYGAGFLGEVLGNLDSDLLFGGFDAGLGYQLRLGDTVKLGAAAQLRVGMLDYGDSTVVDTTGQVPSDADESFTSAAFAVRLLKGGLGIGLAATAKRWGQDFGFQKTTGVWAYDVGVLVSHTLVEPDAMTYIAFGISAVNLGSDFVTADSTRSLPQAVNYGMTARVGGPPRDFLNTTVQELEIVFNMDYSDFSDSPGAFRAGGEIALMQVVFGRVGWQKRESSSAHDIVFGLGLGLPLKHIVLRADYAVAPVFRINDELEEPIDQHEQKATLYAEILL